MARYPAPLYSKQLPANLEELLRQTIARGVDRADDTVPIRLFFRADDIGVPSSNFSRLISIFQKQTMPLCLAVVPSWLTASRWQQIKGQTDATDTLWCWHQHGRRHRNFETSGKKQEFGPARNQVTLQREIAAGQVRLQGLLGPRFQPFFTPPWNRCSRDAALALSSLGFAALSRSTGARPDLRDIMPDFQVNVDLHTRKETDPATGLTNLLTELEDGVADGNCGIMIHHQRMRQADFFLLATLMDIVKAHPAIHPVRFTDLLAATT